MTQRYQSLSLIVLPSARPSDLEYFLDNLRYQTYSHFEVIVVSAEDKVLPAVKTVECREAACQQASGDLLLFVEQHVVFYDEFIENVLQSYQPHQSLSLGEIGFQLLIPRLDQPDMNAVLGESIQVEVNQSSKEKSSFLTFQTQKKLSRSLHIVIVSNEFTYFTHNGGVGTLYYQLANALLQMGHHVSVIAASDQDKTYTHGRFTFDYVKVSSYVNAQQDVPVYAKNINWSVTAALKIKEIHQRKPIDIIESALWDVGAYAALSLPEKIPVVIRLVTPLKIAQRINRLSLSDCDIALGLAAEKKLMREANALAVISENIGSTIQKEYKLSADQRWHRQLVGMTYWPEASVFPSREKLNAIDKRLAAFPTSAFKVLFMGRLEMRKGIDILLNAAIQIMQKDKGIIFLIAGRHASLWQNYLREKYGSDVEENILFLGEVSIEQKNDLYAFSDVFTFPSRYESFGMVGLEATVHGKPIIAANAGGIPEVVKHEENGLLFPIGDVEGFGEAILQLKNDKVLYQTLCAGARAKRKALSARNMAIESVKLYQSLIV